MKTDTTLMGFLLYDVCAFLPSYFPSFIQVRGEHIIACSATEIAEKVSVLEGHEKEQPSSVALRCARIYAECNPKPGLSSF